MERQAVDFQFNFSRAKARREMVVSYFIWTSGNQVKTEIVDYNSLGKIKSKRGTCLSMSIPNLSGVEMEGIQNHIARFP